MANVRHVPGSHGALLRAIRELKTKGARVGFLDTSKYPDGTPVAYVATIQEFGYPEGNIPARPFFRPTIAEQRDAWRATLQKGARAVVNGKMSVEQMLMMFGAVAAGDVAGGIRKVMTPPLKQSTLDNRQARKKTPGVSHKPLVDTGLMIQSVSNDVVDL